MQGKTISAEAPVRVSHEGPVMVITIANPPVNALSYDVRIALIGAIENGCANPETSAMVIRCEGRSFISGADIREFANPRDPRVPAMIELIETATKPLIAAIHGTALGGGVELSLVCHYRIARSDAVLGLPEVRLGLLPGAGGTQRLSRLVGIERALQVIVDGVTLSAAEALDCGLVDKVCEGDVGAAAVEFARSIIQENLPVRRTSDRSVAAPDPEIFRRHEQKIHRKQPGFIAPLHCLAAVKASSELPFPEGLMKEKELFLELFGSPQAKAMQYAFFAQREAAKAAAGTKAGTPLRDLLVQGFEAHAKALFDAGLAPADLVAALRNFGMATDAYSWGRQPGIHDDAIAQQPHAKEIVETCLGFMAELGMDLERSTGVTRAQIDVAWIMDLGFPAYRGGPMFHANLIGSAQLAAAATAAARRLGFNLALPALSMGEAESVVQK